MLKRIKRAVKAFSQPEASPELIRDVLDENVSKAELLARHGIFLTENTPLGDGNAVFIGEGSHEEFVDMQREDDGSKPWYERLKRMM